MTKYPPLFLFIIVTSFLISSQAYGYSDAELSQMYKGTDGNSTLINIQNAINDHSLKCSDLPADIIAFNCPDTQTKLDAARGITPLSSPPTTPTNSNINILSVIPFLLILLVIPLFLVRGMLGSGFKMPSIFMKKVKKTHENIKQYATGIIENNDTDLSSLDDSLITHSVDDQDVIESNVDYFKRKEQKNTHKPKNQTIPTSHKLLFSLGLMKVKKK